MPFLHSGVTVYRDPLTEGFSHFVASMTAPVASGWSGCRVGLTPTGKRRLSTAHTQLGHLRPMLLLKGNRAALSNTLQGDIPVMSPSISRAYCSAEISAALACAIALRAAGASAIALSITKS